MVGLHSIVSTYADNMVAIRPSPFHYQSTLAVTMNTSGRTWGMWYIPKTMPLLNMTSMMELRQKMDISNLKLVNNLTQQMCIIFNPMVD